MNVEVTVKNREKQAFELALKLISIDNTPMGKDFKCEGYKIIDNELFLSYYSEKAEKFPYPYNLEQTINFAWGWIENNKKPNGHAPDTDGSVAEAFEITTLRCGVGSDDWGMMCSVKPIWFVYGK